MTSNKYNQGDIVWLEIEYSDGTDSKDRPALVISNSILKNVDEYILLPITGTFLDDGLGINIVEDMIDKPLPKKSQIRCNKIVSINKVQIRKKYCSFTKDSLQLVIDKVNELIEVE